MILGAKKITNKYEDIATLIPIENISDGIVSLKNGKKIMILQIEPTNFKLKTILEQNAILEGYRLFLKRCNFNMQILIQTEKKDLNDHIKHIKAFARDESFLKDIADDYAIFIQEVLKDKEVLSRSFYIMVEINNNECEIFSKICEGLKQCDNDVKKCNTNEILNIFKNCLRKKL